MAVDTGEALGAAAQGGAGGAAAGPWGAVAGAGLGLVGSIIGGNKAKKAAAQAAAAQEAAFQRNKALLESIGIPSIEAQEIALQNPEYVGDLVAEAQGDSALTEISTDPILRQNQMNQLAQLRELSDQGLSTVDRIALDESNQEASQADKSRRASILSQMAQRGTADSGAQLAAQLASVEAANQQASQDSNNIAKNAYNNRINAMNQLAQSSAGMENSDFNRQAQVGTAQDSIQRFNAQTRNNTNQYNTTARQDQANNAASTANKQEMYNKGLLQQDYNNRMGQAKAIVGLDNANAQNQAQSMLTSGAGTANMYAQAGQGLGKIATGLMDHYGKDDEKKV